MTIKRVKTKYPAIYALPELGKNVYEVRASGGKNPVTGRYDQKSERFEGPLDKALAHQMKLKAKIAGRPTSRTDTWTMTQLANACFENHSGSRNTLRADRSRWRVLEPLVGHRKVRSLSTYDWDTIFSSLRKDRGLEAATINRYRTTVMSFMNSGVSWGATDENTVIGSKKLTEKKPKKNKITYELAQKVINYLPESHASFVILAFQLGCRRSEIAALRVGDYNERTQVITVRNSFEWDEDQVLHLKGTKTEEVREWKPTQTAIDIIERRIELLRERKRFANQTDYLWSADKSGIEPWHPDRVTKMVNRTCDALCQACDYAAVRGKKEPTCPRCETKLGVNITVQNMRRFSTTLKLRAGINPDVVRMQGGWANAAVMLKHYADFDDSDIEASNAVLDAVSFGSRVS